METPDSTAVMKELGAAGGNARAAALTSEQRAEIARKAATARWSLPTATHGDPDHPLKIGDVEIPCYVLDDGRRVLAQRGMVSALGMKRGRARVGGGDRLANFATGKGVSPFITNDLGAAISNPILFRANGRRAYGYEATILADICDAVLAARKAGQLQRQQEHIADQCEILVRGFARVGIIALVDAATGFEDIRDRLALQAILDKYLRQEFAAWAKKFPDEFYKEIFRLRGWKWRGMKINRPQCVANYTTDIVYARLAKGMVTELKKRNPVLETGRRKFLHQQLLTEDVGDPALSQHLYGVIGLMRTCDDKDWDGFMKLLNKAYPKKGEYPLFKDDDG